MAEHNETGQQGEKIAARYLAEKGYTILETNWRSGSHEIDIVAKKGSFLVIAEVKTRKGTPMIEPEVAVDYNKQRFMIKAANSYILKNNIDLETRFDILTVLIKGENFQVHHIEDAFYPRLQR